MAEEERWTMHGLSRQDPACIQSCDQLEEYILKVGFLPLFRNEIPGFSAEEHTCAEDWFSGDPERDPWEWRKLLAQRGNVAYGKFFDKKAGFISREWFPVFANYRRDGYDFDARWDDELAGIRSKKIMDLYMEEQSERELYSFEVKDLAGFKKDGEKNFEGEITLLQMQTYLVVRDFRRRVNRQGKEYGWGIAVYCTPEHLWGREYVTSGYREDPKNSAKKIFEHMALLYPDASVRQILKVTGLRKTGGNRQRNVLPYPDNLVKALKIENFTPEILTEDLRAGLVVAVGQLREKQQRVIRMKYEEHRSNEEIGKEMDRAAGTIGTYHTKALGKLRWPSVSAWYLAGYEQTLRSFLKRKGLQAPDAPFDPERKTDAEDYCIRIGLSLKQFEVFLDHEVRTIADLAAVTKAKGWYRDYKGIGPKSAAEIERKLQSVHPA